MKYTNTSRLVGKQWARELLQVSLQIPGGLLGWLMTEWLVKMEEKRVKTWSQLFRDPQEDQVNQKRLQVKSELSLYMCSFHLGDWCCFIWARDCQERGKGLPGTFVVCTLCSFQCAVYSVQCVVCSCIEQLQWEVCSASFQGSEKTVFFLAAQPSVKAGLKKEQHRSSLKFVVCS